MMEDRSSARRPASRHPFEQIARIELVSWVELVGLYTRDLCHGGVFIRRSSSPPVRTVVAVHLVLPEGAGTIRFRGEVVHIVREGEGTPGFGVQFLGLTADDRGVLRKIVEQAKATARSPKATAPAVQGVMRQKLASGGERPDGVVQPRRRRRTTKEMAAVRPEGAVVQPRRRRRRTTKEMAAVRSDGVVPEPARPRARRPQRTPSPRTEHRRMFNRAVALTQSKRYAEAAQLLSRAQVLAPDHLDTRVLRCLVLARAAVAERDLDKARSHYEDALRLEPTNAIAQKDLLILSAMASAHGPSQPRRG